MLANYDGGLVPPKKEDRVDYVQVLVHVLLSCQIEQDVLGLGV